MTAKEMFEKLGYTHNLNFNGYINTNPKPHITYEKNIENIRVLISFDLRKKSYYKSVILYNDEFKHITLEEHKAIQQQTKELGWL